MKKVIKKMIPWPWMYRIRKWRYHYLSSDRKQPLSQGNRDQIAALKELPNGAVLFAGHIKSGNTWLRFLIFNYFNILNKGADSTLTYKQLNNEFQRDSLGDPVPIRGPIQGFPHIVRTHLMYHNPEFEYFQKGIYIYRNPLDTLVSSYHFMSQQNTQMSEEMPDINQFVLQNLVSWEAHLIGYFSHNRFLKISYEALKSDTLKELKKVIDYLGYDFDEAVGAQSVQLSSFEEIKKMGKESNQRYGNGGESFKGEFARKGKVGSFSEELSKETIRKGMGLLKKYGFHAVANASNK